MDELGLVGLVRPCEVAARLRLLAVVGVGVALPTDSLGHQRQHVTGVLNRTPHDATQRLRPLPLLGRVVRIRRDRDVELVAQCLVTLQGDGDRTGSAVPRVGQHRLGVVRAVLLGRRCRGGTQTEQ